MEVEDAEAPKKEAIVFSIEPAPQGPSLLDEERAKHKARWCTPPLPSLPACGHVTMSVASGARGQVRTHLTACLLPP
jgi:hypothetical protein